MDDQAAIRLACAGGAPRLVRGKTVAAIILSLTTATAAYAGFGVEPFQSTFWFADAVVVGAVVTVNDETFRFEVREWMRARECQTPKIILATRYAIPSDVLPQVYVPLSKGSSYLLLLRKPHDEGAGDNPNWLVLLQIDLATASHCLTGERSPRGRGPTRLPAVDQVAHVP
jgi:hypothetical protein